MLVGTWNLENLFRPGGAFGPHNDADYRTKLAALAATVNAAAPDVLGVQEVGSPEALADLVESPAADPEHVVELASAVRAELRPYI